VSKSSVYKLRLKVLNSSAERQLCDSEFQTEGALTLKAFVDNESVILTTDSNSLSVDRSVRFGSSSVSDEKGRIARISRNVGGSRLTT